MVPLVLIIIWVDIHAHASQDTLGLIVNMVNNIVFSINGLINKIKKKT